MKRTRHETYLADKNVADMLPGDREYELVDAAEPSLRLRVLASGSKVFNFKSKKLRIKIGNWPRLSCEEARTLAGRMREAEEESGSPLAPLEERHWFNQTVAELFAQYSEKHLKEHTSPKTYIEASRSYSSVLGGLGQKPIGTVTSLHIQEWVDQRSKEKGAAGTRRWFTLLKAALRFCNQHSITQLKKMPTDGIKTKADKERTVIIRPEKFGPFLEAVDRLNHPDHRAIIKVLVYTALRKSVVLAMRWEDIDMPSAQWQPPRGHGNKRVPLVVALIDPAMEILRRRKEEAASGFVFPAHSASGHVQNIYDSFRRAAGEAGLPEGFCIHSLRHSTASAMGAAGVDVLAIQRVLGHSSPRQSAKYTHLDTTVARSALEKGMDLLMSKMPPSKPTAPNVVLLWPDTPQVDEPPVMPRKPPKKQQPMGLLSPAQIIQIKAKILVVAQQNKNGVGEDLFKRDFFRKLGSQFGPGLHAKSLAAILDEMENEDLIESWRQPGSWQIKRYRLKAEPAVVALPVVANSAPSREGDTTDSAASARRQWVI